MSAPFARVAGQVAARRMFSSTARTQKAASAASELRALFGKTAQNPQPADWGKVVRDRSQTFGVYVFGMTAVLAWPMAAKWAWNGTLGNGLW